MDYAQEQIATLHDLTGGTPDAPLAESAVVVPIAGESKSAVTPTHIFETIEAVGPADVVVPLRAPADVARSFAEWLAEFDLSVTVLWCNAPELDRMLAEHGLGGESGKGRDVWLGLGVAADRAEYVAVHDADATTYTESHLPRLLAPLSMDYRFVKGYYARVENDQLYGRLTRLFVAPVLDALARYHEDPLVDYLSAFRYPLAGEIALTADVATSLRAQRTWGLEIGMLGEVYSAVGQGGTAQVDLGIHRHDHRPVEGNEGLSNMAPPVGEALFRTLADHEVDVAYDRLQVVFEDATDRLLEQYAAEASFNGLSYDMEAEREQSRTYRTAIDPPGTDTRLPAWTDTSLSPAEVLDAATAPSAATGNILTD